MTQADHWYFAIRMAKRTYLFDWIKYDMVYNIRVYFVSCQRQRQRHFAWSGAEAFSNEKFEICRRKKSKNSVKPHRHIYIYTNILLTLWNTIGTCTFSLNWFAERGIWEMSIYWYKHRDGGCSVLSLFIEIYFFYFITSSFP